ncbi:MAG: V-type ATP synthase subunit E [Treponema sp.]|jgi:V/A-type H+-transporting ATPase subunit E|nr:V-type ATP synthase subunit E [Treponema sp.]
MEVQLQELIDKIKKDGIESASEEAARVKREAEAEAARIVSAARREADDIVSRGKADAARSEKAGIAALEQASRNLVLAFKGEIQSLLDKLVTGAASSAYSENTLKEVLPGLLKEWVSKGGSESLDLLLPENELNKLKGWATSALAAELNKGLELKSDRHLAAGFRIANKDGSAYYDFSAESVAELLSAYLNPHLAGILKSTAQGSAAN